MADSATTPAVKNAVELEADVNVEFNEATSRQQINSGESVKTLFGKLRKFLTDLKAVAFTGAYSDLSGTPDLSQYASKSKYGDTTIDVGRRVNAPIGEYSSALGIGAVANGYAATAEGSGSQAAGYASHAGGYNSCADKNSSFAHGYQVEVYHDNEVAFGKHNVSNDDTLFSIGDGTEYHARHNAFEITTIGGKLHDKDIATTENISNPNLLINPDFKINQRGVSGTFSETGKYFVDRWRLISGTVTVNSDGTLTLNGTISQIFENAVGDNVTASVSAGAATYDNSTKTFSITANNKIISWAKLEYGSNATQFFPPDPSTELLKCMRYYEVILGGTDRSYHAILIPPLQTEADIQFMVPKRIAPTTIINGIRTVVTTSTNYLVSFTKYEIYQTEIYGITLVSVDPVITELPSYLLGVTLDGVFAVDAEIY